MYSHPDDDIVFGDVFCADAVFHDAHLADDSTNVGRYVLSAPFKDKFTSGIARTLNRPVQAPADGLPLYSPAIPLGQGEDGLLAHGLPTQAVVLSDDCDIEEALGRDGSPSRGRLLFASVTTQSDDAIEAVRTSEPRASR